LIIKFSFNDMSGPSWPWS